MSKILLYCTKAKPYLVQGLAKPNHTLDASNPYNFYWKLVKKSFSNDRLNGKIVAECDFEVEELRLDNDDPLGAYWYETETLNTFEVLEKSCLTDDELFDYLGEYNEGYAIHIKNLHIFDKPKELSQYHKPYGCINISCGEKPKQKYLGCSLVRHCKKTQIKKAPQNMMKVESKICDEKDYILISIRPKWLCKILNGEKTIEVRKKVLKGMLGNDTRAN